MQEVAMHHFASMLWMVLFYSWIGFELVIALATRTSSGGGKVRDRGTQLLLWATIVPAVTACEWLHYVSRGEIPTKGDWLTTLAVAVMLAALAIRWTAIRMLGKAFSANVAIRGDQRLNTRGIYGWVRHPSYLGLLLVFVAIGLHSRHWLGLVVMLAPTAALIYRIHVEEIALREAFGPEYAAYSQRTKRLVPGIY
jgi:protein-S-isoprenylcysteine O-methyltransferase Ste14